MMHDLSGQKIGKWTVLHRVMTAKGGRWICRCECGIEKTVMTYHLTTGRSKSCHACYGRSRITHGHSRPNEGRPTPEYQAWISMGRRCTYPNDPSYERYGGRGISVCGRWGTFENFLADMGLRPSPTHSVDRIDGNGNYEPGNCRWAVKKEQSRNIRTNRIMEMNGAAKPLCVWAEEFNINRRTVMSRLRRGWDLGRALTEPLRATA